MICSTSNLGTYFACPRLSLILADASPLVFLEKTTYSPPSLGFMSAIWRVRTCLFPLEATLLLKRPPGLMGTPSLDHLTSPIGLASTTHSNSTVFPTFRIFGFSKNLGAIPSENESHHNFSDSSCEYFVLDGISGPQWGKG